jgi:hypothetical protein
MGDAHAVDLLGQDVIDTPLEDRDLALQTFSEPLGDFTKEYAGLRDRIKKRHRLVSPNVRAFVVLRPCVGEGVQHLVGELWGREHLVAREVRDTGQDIRIATADRETSLLSHRRDPLA